MIPQVSIPEGSSGIWRIEHFEVPQKSIESMRLALSGRGIRPGWYTRLVRGHSTIMSDTPAEMRDHYEFVKYARGHCIINGLGIGMCLGAALKKPEVTRVTVVEKSEDVIRLVAPSYEDERVEIVHADAFEYKPPKGIRYGAVWHDIWDNICADNLPEMHRLHRKYGRISDWQGSWARWQCERGRR
jgi:hypothetical protein